MHAKESETMCFSDDAEVDKMYEPPAKKNRIALTAVITSKVDSEQHTFKSSAKNDTSIGPQNLTNEEKGYNSVHKSSLSTHFAFNNSSENTTNTADASVLQKSADNLVKDDKTFCDTFYDFSVEQKLLASELKSESKIPVVSACDLISPKMPFKDEQECKPKPSQNAFRIDHFRAKEDSQLSDFLDCMIFKGVHFAAEALNAGLDCMLDSVSESDSILKILDILLSKGCSYPLPNILNMMFRTLLQEKKDKLTKYCTFWYLHRLLIVFKPDRTSHRYYYDALFFQNEFKWEEICQIIESGLQACESYGYRCSWDVDAVDFLKLFVTILTKDCETSALKDFLSVRVINKQAFVSLLFFTPENMEQRRLQALLRFINVLAARSSLENRQVDLLKILIHLLHLFAETVRFKCACHKYSALSNDKLNFITKEILIHCRDVLGDKEKSRVFLGMLSPTWLKIKVAESLLTRLVSRIPLHCFELPTTLRKIVRQYIFPPSEKFLAAKEKYFSSSEAGNDEYNNLMSLSQVMKPNHKGETLIHIQCLRNKPELLEEILMVPGIDINVRDYAGWTPLHECCNSGNLECAKLLVMWFPLDEKYVTVFADHLTGADLCALNDGTTPLHEAVISNHAEIAQLLLEYGGPSLIKIKDNHGKTPHDHATNAQLMTLLEDARKDTAWKRKNRFDHENFSFDRDLSYSKRSCPTYKDPADYSYYAHLLAILLQGYVCFNDLLPLQKFVKKGYSPGDLKSLVEKFLTNNECTLDINNIVRCLDDLFVLQSLPEILESLSHHFESASSSDEGENLLLSLELQLCCL